MVIVSIRSLSPAFFEFDLIFIFEPPFGVGTPPNIFALGPFGEKLGFNP